MGGIKYAGMINLDRTTFCLRCRDSLCGQDSGAGAQDCAGHSELGCQGVRAWPSARDPRPPAQEHAAVGGGLHGRRPPDPAESRQRAPAGDCPQSILNIFISCHLKQVPTVVFIIKHQDFLYPILNERSHSFRGC